MIQKRKESFVSHVTDFTAESYCQRGSSRAEQKHSSILNHLGKDYVGELEDILLLFLRQQMHHTLQINNLLLKDYYTMRIKNKNHIRNDRNNISFDASMNLCKIGYEMFHASHLQSIRHEYKKFDNRLIHIWRKVKSINIAYF